MEWIGEKQARSPVAGRCRSVRMRTHFRAEGFCLFMVRRRRDSLKRELLKSAVRRRDVNVSFRIGGHMMAAAQHARAADGLHNVERLAIEHDDFRASSDVQELLV